MLKITYTLEYTIVRSIEQMYEKMSTNQNAREKYKNLKNKIMRKHKI